LSEPQYSSSSYLSHYLLSSLKVTQNLFIEGSGKAKLEENQSNLQLNRSSNNNSSMQLINEGSVALAAGGVELFSFIESSLKDNLGRELLENNYPSCLVLLFAMRGNIARSTVYLKHNYITLIKQWVNLPPLAKLPRVALLQNLHKLTEISEFLTMYPHFSSTNLSTQYSADKALDAWLASASKVSKQLDIWGSRLPAPLSSVLLWDDLITNRACFALLLHQTLQERLKSLLPHKQHQEDSLHFSLLNQIQSQLGSSVVELYRTAAHSMASNNNYPAARAYLSHAKAFSECHGVQSRQLHFLRHFSSLTLQVKQIQFQLEKLQRQRENERNVSQEMQSSAKQLYSVLAAITELEHKLGLNSREQQLQQPINIYRLFTLKARISRLLGELVERQANLSSFLGNETAADWYQTADDELTVCTAILAELTVQRRAQVKDEELLRKSSKSFLLLAEFANFRLSGGEEHLLRCPLCSAKPNNSQCDHLNRLSTHTEQHLIDSFTSSVLNAMLLNNPSARGLFPRLLQLVSSTPRTSASRHYFQILTTGLCNGRGNKRGLSACHCESASSSVQHRLIPVWMFLQWIPQLLAVINDPNQSPLVFPILIQIAKLYPQALYFPFNLSLQSLTSPLNPIQLLSATAPLIKQLQAALNSRLVPCFIEAADGLTFPEHKFKDFSSAATHCVKHADNAAAIRLYQQFSRDCLSGSRKHVGSELGKFNRDWAKKYKSSFDETFGEGGAKIAKMNWETFNKARLKISQLLAQNNDSKAHKGQRPLADYSSWLARYEEFSAKFNESLELPGQYTGEHEPNPAHHIKIVNFDSVVLVMNSMRRPKRINIHGDNEKDYFYLVKGGEDLRLDERIEQLFSAMNQILQADSNCNRRELRIRTYQVFPLTTNLGMLEWVDNTVPLKALIIEQLPTNIKPTAIDLAYEKYVKFIDSSAPTEQANNNKYNQLLEKVSTAEVTRRFTAIENLIPPHLLLRGIEALCCGPEGFLLLRSRFARSFAVLSIGLYILGMGDRHLENFLVDKSGGDLVSIDFGAAFGFGVNLPVPELMPIRFTRQLSNFLHPLDSKQLMKQDMIYSMTALRSSAQKLLNLMQVFILEPHLDWLAHAKEQNKTLHQSNIILDNSSAESLSNNNNWYPRKKIGIAASKLKGVNSALIMIEELKDNPHISRRQGLFDQCVQHIKGPPNSLRNSVGNYCSTVEEQIDCLLEHSTDPNILGRTWQGWNSFV
jgi:hypothetical protein